MGKIRKSKVTLQITSSLAIPQFKKIELYLFNPCVLLNLIAASLELNVIFSLESVCKLIAYS